MIAKQKIIKERKKKNGLARGRPRAPRPDQVVSEVSRGERGSFGGEQATGLGTARQAPYQTRGEPGACKQPVSLANQNVLFGSVRCKHVSRLHESLDRQNPKRTCTGESCDRGQASRARAASPGHIVSWVIAPNAPTQAGTQPGFHYSALPLRADSGASLRQAHLTFC